MMAEMDLQEKVQTLLDLLEDIEKCIRSNPSSLSKEVGAHLADRLYEVAEFADKEYNVVEIDESQGSVGAGEVGSGMRQDRGEGRASVGQGGVPQQGGIWGSVKQEGVSTTARTAKQEGRVPSPPPPLIPPTTAPSYNRFTNPQPPPPLDEATRKRRREAEALVRNLQKKQSYTCGVSYPGDKEERDFSEGIKADLKSNLPALKTHRHLFRYMAWATMERLECKHCRQCTNTYP